MSARALVTAVFGASLSFAIPVAAAAQPPGGGDPPIVVTPGDPDGRQEPPSVGIGVTDRGSGRSPGVAPAGGGSGRASCTYLPAADWERWVRQLPSADRGPGVGGPRPGNGKDRIDPNLHLYARNCGGVLDYVWILSGTGVAAAGSPLTPAELARAAYGRLVLPLPVPRHSPDLRLASGPAVVVGEHTWVWTDPLIFTTQRRRVQVGAVWAQVVATPVVLRFDPGDGTAVVACRGGGTPFDPARFGPHAASPTCDHVYARSSFGLSGERVTARYEITWRVRWIGAVGAIPAAGVLPDLVSRAAARFGVAEAQALITG